MLFSKTWKNLTLTEKQNSKTYNEIINNKKPIKYLYKLLVLIIGKCKWANSYKNSETRPGLKNCILKNNIVRSMIAKEKTTRANFVIRFFFIIPKEIIVPA